MEEKLEYKDPKFKADFKSPNKFKDRKSKDKNLKDQMPSKDLSKLKKGRIIVRNIPFGIEEVQLANEFGKFGEIHELTIPKFEDGRQKGFAFINFKKTMYAIKAVKEMNGKQLSSNRFTRMIAVDFSMSKDKYINHMYSLKKIDILNEEQAKENNLEIKEEQKSKQKKLAHDSSSDESSDEENKLNEENKLSEENERKFINHEDEFNESDQLDEEDQANENELVDQKEDKKILKNKNKFLEDDKEQVKQARKRSNDIEEGKTVFIKNLSYETTQESLTDLMKQFGELEYCIICMDKITEHSKGTAFAKFKNKESADQCIEKSNNKDENEELFYLDGRILEIQLAISKDQLDVKKLENEKARDKRNLYLSREGLIYPDSPSAANVSAEDLKKRLSLTESKKKQLENLHYFIPKNRLCFHNLPANLKDEDLRKLCLNVLKGEKDVKILFCKIMKNRDKQTNKFTTSKGFGFVSFSTHKHALRVLRALNNNPDIFTNDRRPIVEFSVENLNALMKNKQYIIKESLELDLEDEYVEHQWAGFQTKPFGNQDNVINLLNSKRMKDKKKQLQQKVKEQRVEKREEKSDKLRKESIKFKRERIEENRRLKKRKMTEQDSFLINEMKFLSKIPNPDQTDSSKHFSKPKSNKKKKWYS